MEYETLRPGSTPFLFTSVLLLTVALTIDASFCLRSLSRGKGLGKLGPVLLHHTGFIAWAVQLLSGNLRYSTGISYAEGLVEFCFPLRLWAIIFDCVRD
jgi:hypothetical protein